MLPRQLGREAETRYPGADSVSPERRDALMRKFTLSQQANSQLAHDWRVLLRRFNRAEDGLLLFNEFLTAVRSRDVPAPSRALVSWSEREVEEIWLAVCDERARPGSSGVDIEELVHFLCSSSGNALPSDRERYTPGHSAGRARGPSDNGDRYLQDSLEEYSPALRPSAGAQQRASATSSPPRARDSFAGRTFSASASADGRGSGSTTSGLRPLSVAMSPGKPQRTESAGSTRSFGGTRSLSSPEVVQRTGESIERHVRRMSPLRSSRNGSPIENLRTTRVVEHTSARDNQYVQHLEQQLEQQQERIALLNQLQHETESHVAELRQENIRYSSDLAASTTASHATAAKLKELEQELNGMKEETGKLLKALATEERLKEHALEQASLSNAATEREVCPCVTLDTHKHTKQTHTHTHTHTQVERVSALEQRLQDMTVDKSELAHQKQRLIERLHQVIEDLSASGAA
jgi:hypothetical protein